MPITPPSLSDRSYEDLVAELLRRIPAHTPEYTHPVAGDPGRTLIELFAWLADTVLYRANLIPERQRLAFLRLLGIPLRPARPARGLVALSIDDDAFVDAVTLKPQAIIDGPVPFETEHGVTVLPVTAEAYIKRPLTLDEADSLGSVVDGLRSIYSLSEDATPYVTTPVFQDDRGQPQGLDLATETVDHSLWLALMAPSKDLTQTVRRTLGSPTPTGSGRLLSVGVSPRVAVPALFEEIGPRGEIPHVWEVTGVTSVGETRFRRLDSVADADTTSGLRRQGVQRLVLPLVDFDAGLAPGEVRWIEAPGNDVRDHLDAGVGERPPRLDDQDRAARLVTWVRLRPTDAATDINLSWCGVNAVEIDQRSTVSARIVAVSDGAPDQVVQLPGTSVDPDTLELQVDEENVGFRAWTLVDDLAFAAQAQDAFELDAEAGTVRFGDGVRGRIPPAGRRIRVATVRSGGGAAGNLPAGVLTKLKSAKRLDGSSVLPPFKAVQPVPAQGGEDAETLAEAERRIPSRLRHRDRAVTEHDYHEVASETPGVRLGRVEVLEQFKPHQRRQNVPGVVSVIALPFREGTQPPAPRPDRPTLERVHAHLDQRRPLSTELYVIGCEYVPLGLGVGVQLRDGFARDAVLQQVSASLHDYLWPLAPGGLEGEGWALGRTVSDREMETTVARTKGVLEVAGVSLFQKRGEAWEAVAQSGGGGVARLRLEAWQLPELLSVVVVEGDAPTDLSGVPNPFAGDGIPIPVVPEVC